MIRQEVKIIKLLFILFDVLSVIIAANLAYFIKWKTSNEIWTIDTDTFLASIAIIALSNTIALKVLNVYDEKRNVSQKKHLYNTSKGITVSFCILAILIFLFQEKTYSRLFFGLFGFLTIFIIILQKIIILWFFESYLKNKSYSRRLLIIGSSERGKYILNLMSNQVSLGHQIVGFLPVDNIKKENSDDILDIESMLKESCIDEIIFALNSDKSINLSNLIGKCKKAGVICRILPSLWNPSEKSIEIESLQGVPFIVVKSSAITEYGLIIKRGIDLLFGLIGSIILILSFPIIAIAIKLDTPGPVIYRQKRVGKHGRIFTIIKYRTMKHNADEFKKSMEDKNEMQGPIFKIQNDPRITKVGKWLRKTSLDEIPQFWNILKGDMSLIGTRPPTIEEVKKYKLEHLKRIAIKPGLTGMWQVSGRNLVKDFQTILELDYQYIENWNLKMELKILAKTIWVVLRGKGAC